MEIDISNYDVAAIRGYFESLKEEKENEYGTAMMSGLPFAMFDLINVGYQYDVSNKSDGEVIIMAYNMGILDSFYLGKRY